MQFTYKYLKKQYQEVINSGYKIITCREYAENKSKLFHSKVLVNRIDIDFSVKKTERILDVFEELGINGTFFLRLHAPEYNPFSFESYNILKRLLVNGHELGYHSEVIDQAAIWGENPKDCLKRDLEVMEKIFGKKVFGVASHGGLTGLNNLEFWKNNKPKDFGLLYEGYDKEKEFNLFQESLYISDSEWTKWKCYKNGKLLVDDRRSLEEHAKSGVENLIYLLVHPDTYYDKHFYET